MSQAALITLPAGLALQVMSRRFCALIGSPSLFRPRDATCNHCRCNRLVQNSVRKVARPGESRLKEVPHAKAQGRKEECALRVKSWKRMSREATKRLRSLAYLVRLVV